MLAPGDRVWYLGESPGFHGRAATVLSIEDSENVRVVFDFHARVGSNRYYVAFKKNLYKLSLLEQIAEAARDET